MWYQHPPSPDMVQYMMQPKLPKPCSGAPENSDLNVLALDGPHWQIGSSTYIHLWVSIRVVGEPASRRVVREVLATFPRRRVDRPVLRYLMSGTKSEPGHGSQRLQRGPISILPEGEAIGYRPSCWAWAFPSLAKHL